MKTFLFFALLFASVCAQAQTKRIAHRSHSGPDKDFSLFGTSDNFGDGKPHFEHFERQLLPVTDSSFPAPDPPRVIKTSWKFYFIKAGETAAGALLKHR